MFDSSQQHNRFLPDRVIPCEHLVSLVRGNVLTIPRCRDTFFSILTYRRTRPPLDFLYSDCTRNHTVKSTIPTGSISYKKA